MKYLWNIWTAWNLYLIWGTIYVTGIKKKTKKAFLPCATLLGHTAKRTSTSCAVTLPFFCRASRLAHGEVFAVCPWKGSGQRRCLPAVDCRGRFAVCNTAFAVCLRHTANVRPPVVSSRRTGTREAKGDLQGHAAQLHRHRYCGDYFGTGWAARLPSSQGTVHQFPQVSWQYSGSHGDGWLWPSND